MWAVPFYAPQATSSYARLDVMVSWLAIKRD